MFLNPYWLFIPWSPKFFLYKLWADFDPRKSMMGKMRNRMSTYLLDRTGGSLTDGWRRQKARNSGRGVTFTVKVKVKFVPKLGSVFCLVLSFSFLWRIERMFAIVLCLFDLDQAVLLLTQVCDVGRCDWTCKFSPLSMSARRICPSVQHEAHHITPILFLLFMASLCFLVGRVRVLLAFRSHHDPVVKMEKK